MIKNLLRLFLLSLLNFSVLFFSDNANVYQFYIDLNSINLINQFNENTILVNTSRGPVIDSLDSIYEGLINNKISFLGLDVLPEEPPSNKEKLIKKWKEEREISERIIINPHSAYYSLDSWPEMREKASMNAKNYILSRILKNRVN